MSRIHLLKNVEKKNPSHSSDPIKMAGADLASLVAPRMRNALTLSGLKHFFLAFSYFNLLQTVTAVALMLISSAAATVSLTFFDFLLLSFFCCVFEAAH